MLIQLEYVKGTYNVVTNALSRLDMNENPMEDTWDSLLGFMECFGTKKAEELNFSIHSTISRYKRQKKKPDETIAKILKSDNTQGSLSYKKNML